MQVAVFHPGTQHSWQTALALQQLERLEWYATSIFYKGDQFPFWLERIPGPIGKRLAHEFSRFQHSALDPRLVRTSGMAEWLERLATRAGRKSLASRLDAWGNRRFVEGIGREVISDRPFALWGYNASSLDSFALAKRAGRPLILDRTIGDFRLYNRLMEEVSQTHRQWFIPADRAVPEAQIERDQREYELADVILAGSEYCAQTVREWGGKHIADKLRVLPYCYDEALFSSLAAPQPLGRDEPIRFLFIGQINPRKGIHHLLEAFARIPRHAASLTLVGEMRVPVRTFGEHAARVTHIPTVPRQHIPAIMASHHVLVFPSYFEGSALSLLEALACGMGIIQTRAAGNGASERTGLVIDRLSTDSLFSALMETIEDRGRIDLWRANAQQEAANYSFAKYRDNIASLLDELSL